MFLNYKLNPLPKYLAKQPSLLNVSSSKNNYTFITRNHNTIFGSSVCFN